MSIDRGGNKLSTLISLCQDKLSKSVNMRAMNMLGKAEEKVQYSQRNLNHFSDVLQYYSACVCSFECSTMIC